MNKIHCGDCLELMKEIPENGIDAIVTDPPYGLSFMGKKWDYNVPTVEVWKECLRVVKPGGFLLSFAGTRTYHRLACGIEDAGFEIRDTIMWLYGSGFPKSLNIGKQIDKMNGIKHPKNIPISENNSMSGANYTRNKMDIQSEQARQWEGWGTALKPACEPIVVARKPLSEKNVALNVLKWGTGGINIDACRINAPDQDVLDAAVKRMKGNEAVGWKNLSSDGIQPISAQGRFPANIILDEEAGELLDEQSGISKSEGGINPVGGNYKLSENRTKQKYFNYQDKGGASRFFYCAKASKSERNLGCEDMEDKKAGSLEFRNRESGKGQFKGEQQFAKNNHPTVKPIKLMEYLIKLVSKEQALILDPFLGSGTTAIACVKLNRRFIGIEKEAEYIRITQARLAPYLEQQSLLPEVQDR